MEKNQEERRDHIRLWREARPEDFRSSPEITFVVFNLMSVEKGTELFLKNFVTVVFSLVRDV